MGGPAPENPQGRSASGGPEQASFLERSGREEAERSEASAAGKKLGRDGFIRDRPRP
jgi:hypothetical protein